MILKEQTPLNIIETSLKFLTSHVEHSVIQDRENLINHHPEIDEVYLYAKDPYNTRYI